jgi:hypothetical protein
LINTFAVSNLIREGKTFQIPSVMQTSAGDGMMSFESHLKVLVGQGRVRREDAENFLGRTMKDVSAGSAPVPSPSQKPTAPPTQSAKPAAPPAKPAAPPSKPAPATAAATAAKPVATPAKPDLIIHNDDPMSKANEIASGLKNFVFGGNKKSG